jgi:hypothetical protein
MTRSCPTLLLAALLLAALPAAATAQTSASAAAGAPFRLALMQVADDGVLDEAGLFSPAAIDAARDKIHQIRKEYHCAVLIDTLSRAPAADWSKATSWSGRKRAEYFRAWAKERSRELGVEGIHILICKQPRHVAVVAWPERFAEQFSEKDCTDIERLLTRQLLRSPDETLLTALDRVRKDLEGHRQPGPPSVPLGPLFAFIAGAVGLWLVLASLRLWLRKPEPFVLTGRPETIRLAAGLLAGMFGNPAAFWITDRLFPQERIADTRDPVQEDAPPVQTASASKDLLSDRQEEDTGPRSEPAQVWQD